MAKRVLKKKVKKILIILVLTVVCIGEAIVLYSIKNHQKQNTIPMTVIQPSQPVKPIDTAQKGSIDVLAIGNSDLYSAFNPLQLWHEQGITSYVCSVPKQNMALSYYMLEEILTVKKPKVLLLELDNFFETRGNDNRYEALKQIYVNCGTLFQETERWNDIKNMTFNRRTLLKGYYYNNDVRVSENQKHDMGSQFGKEKIVEYTQKYFPKIMDLAKENNIEVFLINVPTCTSWSYRKHNTVKEYAQKYDVPYLDMNIEDYGIDINWMSDSRDEGNHMNYSGATKITSFIGKYLKENYDLPDHRENPDFNDWNEDYQDFISMISE